MKLTVHTFVSLDGVMQGPGGADEDRSGGFDRGGWLMPFSDAEFGGVVNGWFSKTEALLLGRTTYELFSAFWPQVTDAEDQVATAINSSPKYVVSTTLTDPSWANTSVISGDVVSKVKALKAGPGGELQVHGSCGLIHTLHDAGLVDEYRLLVAPVVLGSGKHLFVEGAAPGSFELVSSERTGSGCQYLVVRPTGELRTAEAAIDEDGREIVR
jgi:dihydrofolate reductase